MVLIQPHDGWRGADRLGIFKVVEGLVDHELLGVHHVNEIVPKAQGLAWDIGFLAWGALMLVGGRLLLRSGTQGQQAEALRSA